MAVDVAVDVIGPVVVAVHVCEHVNVAVIGPVDAGTIGILGAALCSVCVPSTGRITITVEFTFTCTSTITCASTSTVT